MSPTEHDREDQDAKLIKNPGVHEVGGQVSTSEHENVIARASPELLDVLVGIPADDGGVGPRRLGERRGEDELVHLVHA